MPLLRHTLCVFLLVPPGMTWCTSAHAQQAVEFFPGPVVSSNKIISMGGAYTGIASGADAHLINPASFAQRHRPRRAPWFTGDWTLSWFDDAPNTYADDDQLHRDSFHLDIGFHLNFGRFGIGAHGYSQSFGVTQVQDARDIDVSLGYGGLGMGWSFWRDQLSVGLLVSSASLELTEVRNQDQDLLDVRAFRSEGQGVMLGAHLRLEGQPWQVGLRARREIRGFVLYEGDGDTDTMRRGQIVIPKQISVGGAMEFALARGSEHPLLVAGDLVLTGKTESATTLRGFVLQDGELTGNEITLAPHIGAQHELVPDRLRLRAGSYWEPDRARGKVGRAHVTLGGEVRVKLLWNWRIDTCVDMAPGYFNWGLGLGFWTPSAPSVAPSQDI